MPQRAVTPHRPRLARHRSRNCALAQPCWTSAGSAASGGIHERRISLPAFVLKLYVTGATPRANLAIANLRRICEQELQGDYELQIIDVLEHPQLAEDERILATPTLIKQLPPPLRRVIGDLSDSEKVLLGLELRPRDSTPTPKTDS
jgi:circadian clock protein KaiB